MYSEGAINSIVDERTSGLLWGSPCVLLIGSYENSSGTEKIICHLTVLHCSHEEQERKNNHTEIHKSESLFSTYIIVCSIRYKLPCKLLINLGILRILSSNNLTDFLTVYLIAA